MARQKDPIPAPDTQAVEDYPALEYVFTVRGTMQVGSRSFQVPLQVTIDTDTLAALVQQHLEEGIDLREAFLEAYSRSFAPPPEPPGAAGGSGGKKPSQAEQVAAQSLEELSGIDESADSADSAWEEGRRKSKRRLQWERKRQLLGLMEVRGRTQ